MSPKKSQNVPKLSKIIRVANEWWKYPNPKCESTQIRTRWVIRAWQTWIIILRVAITAMLTMKLWLKTVLIETMATMLSSVILPPKMMPMTPITTQLTTREIWITRSDSLSTYLKTSFYMTRWVKIRGLVAKKLTIWTRKEAWITTSWWVRMASQAFCRNTILPTLTEIWSGHRKVWTRWEWEGADPLWLEIKWALESWLKANSWIICPVNRIKLQLL